MDGYITHFKINNTQKYENYYLAKDTRLIKLAEKGIIDSKIEKGIRYYKISDIENYIKEIENFLLHHMEVKDVLKHLYGRENTVENRYKCKRMIESQGFKLKSHEYIPANKSNLFIEKKYAELILSDYIIFEDFYNQQKSHNNARHLFSRLVDTYPESLIRFGKLRECTYIKKNLLDEFQKKNFKRINFDKVDFKTITITEVIKELDLPKNIFYDLLREEGIKIYNENYRRSTIKHSDYVRLIENQRELFLQYQKLYISYKEMNDILLQLGKSKVPERVSKLKQVKIPLILRFSEYKNVSKLYARSEFGQLLKDMKYKDDVKKLFHETSTDYVDFFSKCLKVLDVYESINHTKLETIKMWLAFIEGKITSSEKLHLSKLYTIFMYAKSTKILYEFLKGKEIENYRAKEIEFTLMSDLVEIKSRRLFKSFIDQYNEVLILNGKDLIRINLDLYYKDISRVNSDVAVYSVSEYLKLKKFSSEFNYHKLRMLEIINEIETCGDSPYRDYADYWLFILMHLENGFRPSSVVNLPKVKLDVLAYLKIESLKSLKDLVISEQEANYITLAYKQDIYIHNKNNNEGPFVCSKKLEISFAWAIVLTEFKNTYFIYNRTTLINFKSKNNLPNTVIKRFFVRDNSEISAIKIEQLKLNRTVITLLNTVLKDEFKENSFEVSKLIRAHLDNQTTNGYIRIPQEHMDELTESLFDVGSFGYVYKRIFDEYKENLDIDYSNTMNSLFDFKKNFNVIFGSLYKSENTLRNFVYLDGIKKEFEDKWSVLNEDEIKEIQSKFKFDIAFSRDENYHCIFNKCQFIYMNSCNLCPFSVPSFYEINNIIKRFLKNIKEFSITSTNIAGQKMKLYNFILKDLENIIYFIEKYGEEILEYLLEGKLKFILQEIEKFEDPLLDY